MDEYRKENIINTYFTISILDSDGYEYDEISYDRNHKRFVNIRDCMIRIIEMKKNDKELGSEFGVWDYRIVKHEEDKNTDWFTVYKMYKYRGVYKVKNDTNNWR